MRAAPCDPSPKRKKQRRGCRQDAPRPSEGIFPCSIEASARRNFPLLSRSSANRARQNRGAYKYTCRRFKISLLMSESRERALKSILRVRQEAAEENLVFSSIRIMRLGGMRKIEHTLPRCQNAILRFEIPSIQKSVSFEERKIEFLAPLYHSPFSGADCGGVSKLDRPCHILGGLHENGETSPKLGRPPRIQNRIFSSRSIGVEIPKCRKCPR